MKEDHRMQSKRIDGKDIKLEAISKENQFQWKHKEEEIFGSSEDRINYGRRIKQCR